MNAGNRIRSAYAKGDDEVKARIAHVLGLDEPEQDSEELASIEDRGPEGLSDLQPVEE